MKKRPANGLKPSVGPTGSLARIVGILINYKSRLRGKSHRPGLYCCNECRRQFTVTVGTAMHRSKIPLYKWLMALHLILLSKKTVSIRQLSHKLGIAYHSAWSLAHHIREDSHIIFVKKWAVRN
jgi:transposase-like protein